jgi:hypothetical protein
MKGYKSIKFQVNDEDSHMMLLVDTFIPGDGYDTQTVELWDTDSLETYWKGTIRDLVDIIEAHKERENPLPGFGQVTAKDVEPIKDVGSPMETGVPY